MMAKHCKWFAALCVVLAALVAGCTSTSATDSSGTTTPGGSSNSAVCKDVANLKASLEKLGSTEVMANGLSAISDEFTKIQHQLQTLKTDAKGQYSNQITDLSNAMSGLKSSLDAAKANTTAGTLATVASSVGSVVTAGNNLIMAVSDTC
jgi:hypothetical protein